MDQATNDQPQYEDGDALSESEYSESSDGNSFAMPQREFTALDHQVVDYPLTKSETRDRLLRLSDMQRHSYATENAQFHERYTSEVRRRIEVETLFRCEMERQKTLFQDALKKERKETVQTTAVFRECLDKLIIDRPDLPDDVREAYEKLRSFPLPGEGPASESEGGASSSSTDPVHGDEEEAEEKDSLVNFAMQLQEALGRALKSNGQSERKPGVAPRLSAGTRAGRLSATPVAGAAGEQMPVREKESFTAGIKATFWDLTTGWSFGSDKGGEERA